MTTKVDRLIHLLEELEDAEYKELDTARAHDSAADAALRLIFHIGRQQVAFTPKQQTAFASALASAIKPIQINIRGHGVELRTRLDTVILKKRSALQFLVDTYGEYHINGGTKKLSSVFKQANLRKSIKILDKIIEEFADDSESDGTESDREFSGIPSSHTWW